MVSRATQASLLEQRIAENAANQSIDLTTWIFERISVSPGDRVLELCCGTGSQTLKMLQLLNDSGHLVALDLSRDALTTLVARAGPQNAGKLRVVESSLDELSAALHDSGLQPGSFDLVFCAYGLYYSADPERTLAETLRWLRPGGRIVVIGPFGPNNGPLFNVLRASEVAIPEPVIASSERFMTQTVLPWGACNFEQMAIHTMVNRVRWASLDRVLNYWENTTFYDSIKRSAVEQRLQEHFRRHKEFVNEKWVMLAEMINARA